MFYRFLEWITLNLQMTVEKNENGNFFLEYWWQNWYEYLGLIVFPV